MSITSPITPNQIVKFSRDVFVEYFNKSGFAKYTKTSSNAIIQVKNEQMGKPGMQVNFPVLRQLTGDGVSGSTQLWGSEEALQNTTDVVTLTFFRNGVQITDNESGKSAFDILAQARPLLVNWSAGKLRKDIITNLSGILVPTAYGLLGSTDPVDTVIPYATATDAQKSAFYANNSDRVFAGGVGTIATEADIATKATTITSIADVLEITAAVRDTLAGSFPITPVMADDDTGSKTYVWFVDNYVFSKIKGAIASEIAMADVRGPDNDLMQNGDLYFDGVVIRLIPEQKEEMIGTVHKSFICGAQALILSYGRGDKIEVQNFDYNYQHGVAISTCRGVKKTSYNGVQMNVFTVFTA